MNRKDLLAAGGVAAVLALGWYQFVWSSQGSAAAEAKKEAASAQETATKLKAQVATLQRTKNELSQNEAHNAQVLQAIPDTADVSALIKALQAKAADHKLTLTTVTNGKVTEPAVAVAANAPKPEVASEIPMTLALFGNYPDIVTFIDELGSLSRLLVIDTVALSPVNSATKPGEPVSLDDITATITLRAFTTAGVSPGPGESAPSTTTTAPAASGSSASTSATTAAAAVP